MERSIEATTIVGAASDAIGGFLCRDPRAAVGASAILEASVTHGPAVHREVALTVGVPVRTTDGETLPVGWHDGAHEDLFPTFDGDLVVEPSVAGTRLRLTGTYAVPLGLLGRFGDGVLGRRVAQQSVANWLEGLARRLDDAAGASVAPEYPVHIYEPSRSELYIG